jgi:2-hydroxychromene-2-carboxylate isomerase
MPRRLEFFFDYVSPFSYLANTQLPAIARRTKAELVYRPFFLGGVMQATGNQPPATLPARAKYMPKDIQRWVRRYGIEFAGNPHFPMQTLTAMRAALAAQDAGVFPAYHEALFRAAWGQPKNLGDPAVLRDVIAKAGLDPEPLLAAAATEPLKERLKANTTEAVTRGAFGAPTFFVGDEIFFGNDRLDFVEEALGAA